MHASEWLGVASLDTAFGSVVLVLRILGRACKYFGWMLSVGFSSLIYKASSIASRLGSAADVMISVFFSRYSLIIIARCFSCVWDFGAPNAKWKVSLLESFVAVMLI